MSDTELQTVYDILENQPKAALEDPVGAGWTLPSWNRVMDAWKDTKIIVIWAGNRCITGDSLILDADTGEHRRVDSIRGKHKVVAQYGGEPIIAEAEEPYQKAILPAYRVQFSNGDEVSVSASHLFLDSSMLWRPLGAMSVGDAVYLPRSNWGNSRQGSWQDALRSMRTLADFQSDYPECHHLYDEQLHETLNIVQDVFQLLGDAPKHTSVFDNIFRLLSSFGPRFAFGTKGVQDNTPLCTLPSQQDDHLSILDDLTQSVDQCVDILSSVFCKTEKSTSHLSEDLYPSLVSVLSILESFHQKYADGSLLLDMGFDFYVPCGKSSQIIDNPSRTITRITPIGNQVVWDMEVPVLHNYYGSGCFHHNSGKSFFAHRAAVHTARSIPDAKAYMWHVNEERSVVDTQRGVWDSLPVAYKQQNKKKGQNFSLNYSQKNGFSGSTCILPSSDPEVVEGSSIFFKYYTQYLADSQVAEGWNAHLIHLDEEAPLKLFETMIPRLTDFHGRLILTFTTLKGWTPLINELLRGAETTKTRYSSLLNMDLPIEQNCKTWDSCKIFYWWTEDNPFIDSQELVKMYKNRPLEDKLARLYGVPTNSQYGKFPKFKRNVNVIPHGELPFIKDPSIKVTRYFVTDPGGTKPWVAAWYAVTQEGIIYKYRETPTAEWAVPHINNAGRAVGKPSRGQKPLGWGFKEWADHFTNLEGDEEIDIRICDPGFGTQKITMAEGQTDIFSEMDALGFHMSPCYRGEVEPGIAKINDLFAWDDTQPLSHNNRPKLYVSDECPNSITAYQEFSNCGPQEHFKDWIDLDRYVLESGAMYVSEDDWKSTSSGGY